MKRRILMSKVHKIDAKRRLFIALIIAAIAIAFSPLAAIDAHAIDAYEPNDSETDPMPTISIGQIINADLAPNNPTSSFADDYFAFTISEAGSYTLEFSHAVPAGATDVDFGYARIRTSAGASVGGSTIKLNQAMTYVSSDWLNAGSYYVEVSASSYGDAGFNQPYSFVLKKGGYIDDFTYYIRHSYTGKAISPVTSVYCNYTRLTLGKDYTVSGTKTSVGMGKATVTGIGNYYGTHQVEFAVYPEQIMVKSIKAGKKKLTVSWYKAKSVDKYVVQYKPTSTNKWKSKTVAAKKSSLTISKLQKGKKYNVRIYAYKTVGGKKYNSVNVDSEITTAYTNVPGFSSFSMKTVKVK
jgi:hypothetical protein